MIILDKKHIKNNNIIFLIKKKYCRDQENDLLDFRKKYYILNICKI